MLFDSHAHYNDRKFDDDRFEILDSMLKNNIGFIMNAADTMESVGKILAICEKYPFMYASVGVHPEEVGNLTEDDINTLEKWTQNPKVRAVGEIGLDYHYDDVPKEIQKKWFSAQLEMAKRTRLPVIIHDRDAHGDCMDILREHHAERIGGVLHCYSGSCEMAREILSWGMYIGIGGTLTFKNARKVREVAEMTPLDRILLETDCPYLAPEPYRGERNSSLLMHFTAEKLAEIKGVSVSEVERVTCENAKKLYGIK